MPNLNQNNQQSEDKFDRWKNKEENAVESWQSSLVGSFYVEGIEKWGTHYGKCFNIGGIYVEK